MRLDRLPALAALLALAGCAANPAPRPAPPSVAPATQPTTAPVSLAGGEGDGLPIQPMYRELLAIDLPTVQRVAAARNLDVRQARQRVLAARGRYEASVGAILPVLAPSLFLQHLEGVNQAVNGSLVAVNFDTLLPALAIQWVLNPGAVVYDAIASRKRVEASEQQEQSAVLETARAAAVQYYESVLAQAQVGVARQAVADADELLRITRVRVRAGAGLAADALRAEASLESRRQDLAIALNRFYQASITLSLTLHLDPTVTLVPAGRELTQVALVRNDLGIDQMLALAMAWRPDMAAARTLAAAAAADTRATQWGGFGPQLQAGYQYGGLAARAAGASYDMTDQQKAYLNGGFSLGASTFGRVKTAGASEQQAATEVERQLDQVRAQVVRAAQDSNTNRTLIPAARRQLDSAQEALRLAQANLRAGTMLPLEVLQADDAVSDARLRYATAVARYNQSQVNLLAALGLLSEGRLQPATAPATAAATAAAP